MIRYEDAKEYGRDRRQYLYYKKGGGVVRESSAIFRKAIVTLRATSDPPVTIREAVKKDKVKNKTPLPRDEIPVLVEKANATKNRTIGIALRLLLLTFVRPIKVRAAEWTEFDLDRAEWWIPADRMKMRLPHIVPLSIQAVELLRDLHSSTGSHRYLFPNFRRKGSHMAASTLSGALVNMGCKGKFSAHGFRTTASTALNEAGYRQDVIERQLAHKERNKVRASYNQAEYMVERRQMMQD